MDHAVLHGKVEPVQVNEVKYSNTWLILSAIFMIIPVFNIIFGSIGINKYPKNVRACKTKRTVCMVAYIIGIVQIVIIVLTGIIESIKAMLNSFNK